MRPVPAMAAAVLTALIGGCATTSSPYPGTGWYAGGPPPSQVDPEAVIARAKASAPVIEDDGRPAQVPPLMAARAAQDDPTQPWSPNYGGPATKPVASKPANPPSVSADQDQPSVPAVQAMAARRVSWQSGN